MKRNPTSPGALPRYYLAAVLLSSIPALGQTITNPSFETDTTFTASPGYISSGTNGPITGWTGSPTNRVGLNPSGGSPFADNGAIPNGTKVAFIQNGPSTLSTTATGLTPGTKYHVEARVNARSQASVNGNTPFLVFSTDGTGPTIGAEIQRVQSSGNTTPYRYVGYDFTATATSHIITLSNTKPTTAGDHTVLLDDFTIAPSTNSWSIVTDWDNDATSGINPAYVYTHAYDLNGAQGPGTLINGVPFIGRASGLANAFSFTGLTGATSIPVAENTVTGNSGAMAAAFRYDLDPTITLQNLKPNTQYVFSLYGIGWDAPTAATPYRAATFTSTVPGSEKFTFNLDQRGRGKGMILNYTYTTDASGTPVTISYPRLSAVAGSIHTSGFSNREAVATNPIEWTVQPWDDDATSGASPNHLYTHAFKLGGGSAVNVNGVNFTALAGANPTGTNYTTSGLPSTVSGDVNAVTGYGSALARDFVYGGMPATHTLTGLTPGKSYIFTIYSVGWEEGTRNGVFSSSKGGNLTVLNQDARGDNKGVRFERQYVADASGSMTFSNYGFDNSKTIHSYAVSNREVDPFVGKQPEFTLQPVGAAMGVGTSYTLRAEAIGSANITYQWKHGVTDLPGETNPTLTLSDLDADDAGSYTLVATNGSGTVSSNTVNLVVLENAPGDFGSGVGVDGVALAGGQIDPHFKLIVNPDNPGNDTVYVQSNLPGSWLAPTATSKWIGPRADSAAAAGQAFDAGEGPGVYVYRTTLDLTGFNIDSVLVSGNWSSDNGGVKIKVNGTDVGFPNLAGTTFGQYVSFNVNNTAFPGLLTTGVNTFDFVVRNDDLNAGFTGLRLDSFAAIGEIPVGTAPYIAVQPQGFTGVHGSTGLLAVGATGSATMTYQWYKGSDPMPGETAPVLSIPIDTVAANGNYKVRVTNGSGFLDSNVAAVSVTNTPPSGGDDLFNGEQDTPLQIAIATELLVNDSDIDHDVISLNGFSATTAHGGTVVQDVDVLVYTPAPGFTGDDSFTYTLNDGDWGGISAAVTVAIHVESSAAAAPVNFVVALVSGDAVASFTGSAGGVYTLQRSTTMNVNDWTDVDTDTAPAGGAVQLVDPDPPAGRAFYRISYPSP